MIIDTMLRNTILADKMVASLEKTEKISTQQALDKLEEMTPLAKIVLNAKPKPKPVAAPKDAGSAPAIEEVVEIPDGAKPGPIDVEYKSHMAASAPYAVADSSNKIKTWGRKGEDNAIMGVWGEFVSVDFDICVADGACICRRLAFCYTSRRSCLSSTDGGWECIFLSDIVVDAELPTNECSKETTVSLGKISIQCAIKQG